jgi:hypothetical protein
MSIEKAEKSNGFKYRSHRLPTGEWTDPFVSYDFFSRTFMPENTEYIEATTEEDMVNEVKKGSKQFRNLSKESRDKFIEHRVEDKIIEDEKDIDNTIIGMRPGR